MSHTMPVDCDISCQQTICELNNDGVSFFGQDCWTGALSIDGDNHLLKAIRRLVLILHLPSIPSDSSLCCWKHQYWKEKTKQNQKSHHTLPRSLKKFENLRQMMKRGATANCWDGLDTCVNPPNVCLLFIRWYIQLVPPVHWTNERYSQTKWHWSFHYRCFNIWN